jgi:glycosyltransferase involved in cell wall biosynthesis
MNESRWPSPKMRVGFDARWYNDSGVGVYVAELLRAMAAIEQRDFELVVYENPRNPVAQIEGEGVSRVAVSASRYSMAGQLEFRRRSRLDRLDVFHSPFFAVPLGLRCPVVVTVHDLIPFLFRIYNPFKQALIKVAYRAAVRRAGHIIADSENTAGDLHKILAVSPERITTVHIAAAPEYSSRQIEIDETKKLAAKYNIGCPYVMVSSARNWRTKNLEGALQALQAAAQKTGIKFQTVVFGPPDGIEAAGPAQRWTNLSLLRTGYLQRSELAMLFRNAVAFIMPSLYEGFGLPILEAMSCGCPVLTSNAGSLREVAGRGAQVFDPHDVANMAVAVGALLQNPEERRRWKAAALARAADFSWAKAAAETISVYHRVHSPAVSNRPV